MVDSSIYYNSTEISNSSDLQKNVHATKFVAYYLDKIVSKIAAINGSTEGEDPKLELLRQLADMSQSCPALDNLPERLKNLYVAIQVSCVQVDVDIPVCM